MTQPTRDAQSAPETAPRDPGPSDESRGFKQELLGPPRRTPRAQFVAAAFGLLTVLNIALPGLEERAGLTLTHAGLAAMFFSELLDPGLRRFTVSLRIGGLLIAAIGFVLQLL